MYDWRETINDRFVFWVHSKNPQLVILGKQWLLEIHYLSLIERTLKTLRGNKSNLGGRGPHQGFAAEQNPDTRAKYLFNRFIGFWTARILRRPSCQ